MATRQRASGRVLIASPPHGASAARLTSKRKSSSAWVATTNPANPRASSAKPMHCSRTAERAVASSSTSPAMRPTFTAPSAATSMTCSLSNPSATHLPLRLLLPPLLPPLFLSRHQAPPPKSLHLKSQASSPKPPPRPLQGMSNPPNPNNGKVSWLRFRNSRFSPHFSPNPPRPRQPSNHSSLSN